MTDFIYGLLDPRDNRIRYVGKTNNLERRYKAHLREKGHTRRVYWIQSLVRLGMKPILTIIERVSPNQSWEERERYWIKYYREIYSDLTNARDGGDCGPPLKKGTVKRSPETRAKMSAWQVGRKLSAETRKKISLTRKGRKDSQEKIEKKRKWMTGRTNFHTDEFKRKLAERNRQRQYDPEIMRKNARKLWDDPIRSAEARHKLIERNKLNHWRKGKKGDPEMARKSARKLWDDPIKGAEARKKLIERNKKRYKK